MIKTVKYCVFKGEFRCQSVCDVLSTDELFIYLLIYLFSFFASRVHARNYVIFSTHERAGICGVTPKTR